ncbi:uncharacterized protein O3C94_000124 [Discoglossus pictus]
MTENHQTLRTLGVSTNRSSGLPDDNLDMRSVIEEQEDERNGNDHQQQEIQSEPGAGDARTEIVPSSEQIQEAQEQEIQGDPCVGFPTVSISETGEDETEDIDIQQVTPRPDHSAGHLDKTFHSVLFNKKGEDEREETNIQHVDMNSDVCADSDKVTPSVLSESDQEEETDRYYMNYSERVKSELDQEEETNVRSHQQIKEEEIPVNISDETFEITISFDLG